MDKINKGQILRKEIKKGLKKRDLNYIKIVKKSNDANP